MITFLTALPMLSAPAHAADLTIGDAALLFSLPALNEDEATDAVGKGRVALSDLTGPLAGYPAEAVVVYFFRRNQGADGLAALDRLQNRYDRDGLQVVAICLDQGDLPEQAAWADAQKVDFPILRDHHRVVATRYGVQTLPTTFVIDADGVVFAVGRARGLELETELAMELEPLLD